MTRGKIKILKFKPQQEQTKWRVCIRFPTDIKKNLQKQSVLDYSGRGKQSALIEDAVKYYLHTCEDIKWSDYQKDLGYAELIDDIHEGLNQSPLENATQVFLTPETKEKLLEIEKKIKLANPMISDVRTGLIRKAVSIRLSIGDKRFFDAVMESH